MGHAFLTHPEHPVEIPLGDPLLQGCSASQSFTSILECLLHRQGTSAMHALCDTRVLLHGSYFTISIRLFTLSAEAVCVQAHG